MQDEGDEASLVQLLGSETALSIKELSESASDKQVEVMVRWLCRGQSTYARVMWGQSTCEGHVGNIIFLWGQIVLRYNYCVALDIVLLILLYCIAIGSFGQSREDPSSQDCESPLPTPGERDGGASSWQA